MQESSKTFGDLEFSEVCDLKQMIAQFAADIEEKFQVPVSRLFLKDSGGDLQVGVVKVNSRYFGIYGDGVGDSNG